MRKCDSCGKLYQENKDVFCPHCGAVAHKQCTHSSSFDSKRYDRGELYKYNNTQYKNTTYNQGYEPHAQRENTQYNQPQNTFNNNGDYSEDLPKINLPDIKTVFSKGKNQNGKFIGVIVICIVFAFNLITGLLNGNEDAFYSDSGIVSEQEEISELYTIADEAEIEIVDTDRDFKIFTLKIKGMAFDDFLPEYMQNDIDSGAMTDEILSENTFVEMMVCDFSKTVVSEESYDNAIQDSYQYPGKQIDGKCKYEFSYKFDYDEIVHIAGGVNFYLENGLHINAELPFSAFSVSEDGEITYYNSYASDDTAWNTVFSECSNQQEINSETAIDFSSDVAVEE